MNTMASSLDIDVAIAIGWQVEGRYEPGSKYFVLLGPNGERINIKSPSREPIHDAIEYDEIIPRYTRDFQATWKLFNQYIFRDHPDALNELGDLSVWLRKHPYEVCEDLCRIFIKIKSGNFEY